MNGSRRSRSSCSRARRSKLLAWFWSWAPLQVWLTLVLASIGFGGIFAVYTYIAPVVTDVAGLSSGVVPWVRRT